MRGAAAKLLLQGEDVLREANNYSNDIITRQKSLTTPHAGQEDLSLFLMKKIVNSSLDRVSNFLERGGGSFLLSRGKNRRSDGSGYIVG